MINKMEENYGALPRKREREKGGEQSLLVDKYTVSRSDYSTMTN